MSGVLTLAAAGSGGAVLSALLAVDAGQDSAVAVALIAGASGVVVAVVTGVFALLKDRKPEPDPSRHMPEAADLLAQEMKRVDQLRGQVDRLRGEVDVWQERAYQAGWRP